MPESEAAIRNRVRAGAELAMIAELNASKAFEWFRAEFIDKPYDAAFQALRSTSTEDLNKVQATYLALRPVRIGLMEREIAHRRQINKADPEIARLEQQLRYM